ncbi:MAG TPA: hypothetical protein VGA69_00010 [Nitriliruptorales bacterium]
MQLRLLLRPHGIVGGVGAVAGLSALAAAYLPWYAVQVQVQALGRAQTGTVASLPGWQSHPWGWLVPAVALVAVVIALSVAMDRSLPIAGDLQLAGGVSLAVLAGLGALTFPPVARFDVAGSRLRELAGVTLPSDVEMSFSVGPAIGLWITLASAALLVASGLASREL